MAGFRTFNSAKVNQGTVAAVEVVDIAGYRRGSGVNINRRRAQLDKYDVAILSALATNNRLTTVEIAGLVHLSRTAVSRRLASLRNMNVLEDSAYVLNYEAIGFSVRAFVELSAASHMAAAVRTKLLLAPEVLSISVIVGDGRLSLDVIAVDMQHLHGFVDSLRDYGETSTKIIFADEKSRLTLIDRMRMLDEEITSRIARVQ